MSNGVIGGNVLAMTVGYVTFNPSNIAADGPSETYQVLVVRPDNPTGAPSLIT